MSKFFLTLFFTISFCLLFSQENQYFQIKGKVVNSKYDPLKAATVKVLNKNSGTISDNQGEFYLFVKPFDVLSVSFLGYKTKLFSIPNAIKDDVVFTFMLENDTIWLKEAIVTPWPATYEKLKQQIASLKPLKTKENIIKDKYLMDKMEKVQYSALNSSNIPTISIMSPVSMLYYFFGDKPKQYKTLDKLKQNESTERRLSQKFNAQLIQSITKMNNTDSVVNFMQFCNFSEDFLMKNNLYTIIEEIKRKYEGFKSMK